MTTQHEKYPALIAYIESRNTIAKTANWCEQLRADERLALAGELADVARELAQAQADYKAQQESQGRNGYPYNGSMGIFLGLPIKENHEPAHGYYMSNSIMHYFRLGIAQREIESLIAQGCVLSIVTARSKKDRKPIRFARFTGAQIAILGSAIVANDGKRKITLSSGWSAESCMESVARAMRSGEPVTL